jgi:hypothetical protein
LPARALVRQRLSDERLTPARQFARQPAWKAPHPLRRVVLGAFVISCHRPGDYS